MSKSINYLLILVGGLIALYAQAGETQNHYLLIGGIVILIMGLYRISRNVSSKSERLDNDQLEQKQDE